MNRVNKLFGEMYDLFKEALLNDEEFIAEFKAKLEEKEEHHCEGDCGCDGNCGDDCKCKKEQTIETFDSYAAFCERFVLTNDEGEELIDTEDLDVPVEDSNEDDIKSCAKDVSNLIQSWMNQIQEDIPEAEDEEESNSQVIEAVEEDENNFLKKLNVSQATAEDLESQQDTEEIELELTPEELMNLIQQMQENGEADMDIDLGDLVQQLKLVQQQPNYKFMERDPQEYDDIITNSFGILPTDLGGNDEIL